MIQSARPVRIFGLAASLLTLRHLFRVLPRSRAFAVVASVAAAMAVLKSASLALASDPILATA